MDIPVYIFTGFLESGKTTFIMDTLQNPEFIDNQKTLLIVCEEGFNEYDSILLGDLHTDIVYIDSEEKLNTKLLLFLHEKYQPTQVLIEYNGMWNVSNLIAMEAPKNWINVQVLTTINAGTFAMFVNNMRSLVYEQTVHSELVIFNRCEETIKKASLRATIKAINPKAQVIYEMIDGSVDTSQNNALPFDEEADYLDIFDHDYGLFCMDVIEQPRKYENKTIRIKGKFIGLDKYADNSFILGRNAMVCCEDDTSLIGLICSSSLADKLIPEEWLIVEGKITVHHDEDYNGDIPILIVEKLEITKPLDDEYVYFN